MAITQAMLDAERERTTLHKDPSECIAAERGWDACLAFLREHGVTVPAQRLADSVVIVEIPAK